MTLLNTNGKTAKPKEFEMGKYALVVVASVFLANNSLWAQSAPTSTTRQQCIGEISGLTPTSTKADKRAARAKALACCKTVPTPTSECRTGVQAQYRLKITNVKKLTPTQKCWLMGDETDVVECCRTTVRLGGQRECIEHERFLTAAGAITPADADDFRSTERERSLEELTTRKRVLGSALSRIKALETQLAGMPDDAWGRLDAVTRTIEQLPAELRKEFEEKLSAAVAKSDAACAAAVTSARLYLSGRIDVIEDVVRKLKPRVDTLERRADVSLEIGLFGTMDPRGAIGGLKADVSFDWESARVTIGGGAGASSNGLGWVTDLTVYGKPLDWLFIGASVGGLGDAGDLGSTDHAVAGAGPAVGMQVGGFLVEAKSFLGGLVLPGGDWSFGAAGLIELQWRL